MKKILLVTLSIIISVSIYGMGDKVKNPKHSKDSYNNVQVPSPKQTLIGSQSPDFSFTGVDGTHYNLSDFKGKKIILDFWATWCPPCVAEIPHFVAIQKEYPNVQVIGISVDRGSAVQAVRDFIVDKNINYPITMGNEDIIAKFGDIKSIPTTFLIDENFTVKQKAVGYKNKEFFEQHLELQK
jgi:thiol-disulfide isomerase/thioredoxin